MEGSTPISGLHKELRTKSRFFRGVIRGHHNDFMTLLSALDSVIMGSALWLSCMLYGVTWNYRYATAALVCMVLFFLVTHYLGAHRPARGASMASEMMKFLLSWGIVIMLLLMVAYAMKVSDEFSRLTVLTWFISAPLLLMIWRLTVRYALGVLRKNGFNTRKVAIVGARDLGSAFTQTLLDSKWMGLVPIGIYDDRKAGGDRPLPETPVKVIGDLDMLIKDARDNKFDSIYITLPMRAEDRIRNILVELSDTTASAYLVPDFFTYNLMNAGMTNLGDYPVVSIHETPFYGIDGWIKRCEDIILSLLILSVIMIPMLVISLCIKATSPGPVLYKQSRYGLSGDCIQVWKFRTMTVCDNDDEVQQAKKCDTRTTRLGKFLRRTSLDELPQFFNVLQGSMSIVGPRPHAVIHNEQYRQQISGYMLRHKVKPGITGLAQINGCRGETDTLDKMANRIEFDLAYINDWSLVLDLKIIMMSMIKGFSGKNVY